MFDGSNCKTQPGRAAFQGRFSQGCGERKRLRGKGCGAIWGHTAPQALSGGRPSPPRTAGPPLRSAPGTGAAAGASSQRRSLVQPAPPSAQPAPPPQPRRPAGRRQCASSWPGCRPVARACWPARCGRPSAGGGTTAAGRAAIARSPRVFWFSAMRLEHTCCNDGNITSPAEIWSFVCRAHRISKAIRLMSTALICGQRIASQQEEHASVTHQQENHPESRRRYSLGWRAVLFTSPQLEQAFSTVR